MAETEAGKKHPVAIAWDKWLASDEGQQCRAANTLARNTNHYLENRLWRAFMAGANSSPSDAEQLIELRKAANEALTYLQDTGESCRTHDLTAALRAALNPSHSQGEKR